MSDEREEFEAWARRVELYISRNEFDRYDDVSAEWAFAAWQAARAAPLVMEPQLELRQEIDVLAATVERLTREKEGWRLHCMQADQNAGVQVERAKDALAQVERLQADAERYRWLRQTEGIEFRDGNSEWRSDCPSGDELDAAIDAARKGVTP